MEPQLWILAAAALLIAGVITSKTSARFGVPSLLLFLGIGMVAGADGIGIEFDDFELTRSFGVVALAFILFSGGLDTRVSDIRPVLGPGIALASLGVLVTAGVVGVIGSVILDLPLDEVLLLGAVIASTDAAAVFSVLRSRGVRVSDRLRSMLELESGSNDPAAVFLTVAMISIITDDGTSIGFVVGDFALQMGLGAILGYALARLAVAAINRLNLDYDGLYPVFTFSFVLLTFEGVTAVGGSGFLAVYVAGLTMAHHDYLHKRSLVRFHDAIAWLLQIAMFVLLGLLVNPSSLPGVVVASLATAAVLMFVARPLAVIITLLPFRVRLPEIGFVSWVGLRGATPIILATFPVVAAVHEADRLFNVVFFVVLTSVLIQGTTIAFAARRLGVVDESTRPRRRDVSFDTVITGDDDPDLRELVVDPGAMAAGHQLVDLALPHGILVVLVRRGDRSFTPQGSTVVNVGDQLLIVADPAHRDRLDEFFGAGNGDSDAAAGRDA